MRKTTAGLAVAAAAGFVALSAAPASAVPFPNCDTAALAGVYNIPVGDPRYSPDLDSDSDGVGCENANYGMATSTTQQVTAVPTGGAATGVEVTSTDNTAAFALGGGLVLALAAGGTYVVRRRTA
jgi:hypothetical protein